MLADARAAGDRAVEGRALVLLAEIALRTDSDVACASELAGQALEALPDDDLHGLHDARSLLATIAWWVGDAEAARRHGDATIELARATGRRDLESLALSRLAAVANVSGDREEALALTERAIELAVESGSREAIGQARSIAGRCAIAIEDFDAAEVGLREAMAAFEEAGAAGLVGWTKSMLGTLEARRGALERAEELLRDAVRRLRAAQEHGFLVEAERNLAEVLVRQGRLAEAERIAEQAHKTVGREDAWSRASILHALGLVRAAQGRTDEAEALLGESLAILEPTMFRRFADEVRATLESIRSRAETAARPS